MQQQGEIKPIPDPSSLTTENLRHEIAALTALIDERWSGHVALHAARETALNDRFEAQQQALVRAEATMRETAVIHADSHAREHSMAQEVINKSERADDLRYAQVQRATEERVGVLTGRLDALDRQSALTVDRMATTVANAARIDALERALAGDRGKDAGIGLSWQAMIAAISVTAVVVGLLSRIV